jgi:hypothetical protein
MGFLAWLEQTELSVWIREAPTLFYSAPFRAVKSLGPGDDAPRIAKLSATLSL